MTGAACLLPLLLLTAAAPAAAQAARPVFPVQLVPALKGALDLATGDVNGDGAPDLITCIGDNPGKAFIRFGDGHGFFPTSTQVVIGRHPLAIAVGDLDGAAGLDLAFACRTDGRIDILLSTGGGSFSQAASVPAGPELRDVLLADLNGDGFLDLAFTQDTRVSTALGAGDGSFGAVHLTATLTSQPGQLDRADVDHDGKLDLVVTRGNLPGVEVLLGDGAGGFTNGPLLVTPSAAATVLALDVTGDGRADVLCSQGANLQLFVNDGTGSFAAGLAWAQTSTGSISSLAAADIDGDGDLDVLPGSKDLATISPVVNVGGTASSVSLLQVVPANNDATFVAVADFDRDGLPDLAVADASATGDAVSVLRGGLTVAFEAPVKTSLGFTTSGAIASAQLDGGGAPELLLLRQNNVTNERSLVVAGGQPYALVGETPIVHPVNVDALWAGDLTGDGLPDAALLDIDGDFVVPFVGRGGAVFDEQPAVATPVDPGFVTGADLDGDGDTDLLTAHKDLGQVAVLRNDGGGQLAPGVGWPAGSTPVVVRTGDLDGDGDLDVVTANLFSDNLSLLFGDGLGGFGAPVLLPSSSTTRDVQLADLDDDGDLDLLAADGDLLRVLRGDGAGGFVTTATFPAPSANHVQIGDLTGDGALDLLGTDALHVSDVSVFAGAGDGSFAPHGSYLLAKTGSTLLLDADDDGALDLLSGSSPDLLRNPVQDVAPWTVLGDALAGALGAPDLSGTGKLIGGLPISLRLVHAAPGASAFLVLGLSELRAPFKGGTMVPALDVIVPGLPVGPDGTLAFGALWPIGVPAGLEFLGQCWVPDAGGPAGFAASNALRGSSH